MKPPLQILTRGPHDLERGDVVSVGDGKSYVVSKVMDQTRVRIRRTFWQWIKDVWWSIKWKCQS